MHIKQASYKRFTHALVFMLLQVFLSALLPSACITGKIVSVAPTPPAPLPTLEATDTVTPPILPRNDGHEVLYFTNKTGSIVNVGGDFYASGPYAVYAVCTGKGILHVDSSQFQNTFNCSQPAQLQRNQFGNTQNPPPPANLHVQVTFDGDALWEVSVQLVQ